MPPSPLPPALTGVVALVWGSDARSAPVGGHEWSIPTGTAHLAVRADGPPVEVDGGRIGRSVVGGPRAGAYRRDTPAEARSLGVVLTPWAIPALFGISAAELRDLHVPLVDLLGPDAERVEATFADEGADAAVARLLTALATRVDGRRLPGRALTHAIRALRSAETSVSAVATQVGWSERHLRERVTQATGLAPRELARVARLQRLLKRVSVDGGASWAERAFAGGYADASHLTRGFKALTGLTPTEYRPTVGAPNHVPLRNVQAPATGVWHGGGANPEPA